MAAGLTKVCFAFCWLLAVGSDRTSCKQAWACWLSTVEVCTSAAWQLVIIAFDCNFVAPAHVVGRCWHWDCNWKAHRRPRTQGVVLILQRLGGCFFHKSYSSMWVLFWLNLLQLSRELAVFSVLHPQNLKKKFWKTTRESHLFFSRRWVQNTNQNPLDPFWRCCTYWTGKT